MAPTQNEPRPNDQAEPAPSGTEEPGAAASETGSCGGEPASPDPKPSRRRQESRAKLLAAARTLFVERGYHDTRPQDIAKAADVGHGTFYLHFPDKRACFFAFVEDACAELEAAVDRRLCDVESLEARIEQVLIAVIDYRLDNPGVLSAALTSPDVIGAGSDHRNALLGRWAGNWAAKLGSLAERGIIHTDYDFSIIGWTIVGMFNPICTADIVDRDNRDHVIANMTRLLVRGLAKTSG